MKPAQNVNKYFHWIQNRVNVQVTEWTKSRIALHLIYFASVPTYSDKEKHLWPEKSRKAKMKAFDFHLS